MKSQVRNYFKQNCLEEEDGTLFSLSNDPNPNIHPHPTLPGFFIQWRKAR